MNWGGFHALSYLWLALLMIPLVLLYFLKLKRPRAEVPSLVLWRQVLQDQRVNSPFQRFKRNLLLLLQLLLLLFLILAALQPFWRRAPAGNRKLPVLVDCSASMTALDRAGGIERLAEAKRRIREMIDGLAADQELCLIAFDSTARRLTPFTNNKRLLRQALDEIAAADVPSDLEQALRLVQAIARSEPFDEVMLFSDGNVPPRVNFDLSFKLNYQRVPPGGPNLGITAFTAQRAIGGGWNVFVQIEGSAQAAGNALLELLQDEERVASERVTVTRGRSHRMLFEVSGARASAMRAQLIPDDFDSLASDNVARLNLPESRQLRVFVPKSMPSYRLALEGLEALQVFPQETGGTADGEFDLVMSDQPEHLNIAARTHLSVGFVPPDLRAFVETTGEGSVVVDWRRDATILEHVQLADVSVLDQPRWIADSGEADLEKLGYEVLVHGQRGPLVAEKRDDERARIVLFFHTDRSTLPYRVGFPIFIANVAQSALRQAGLADVIADRTGVLPPMTLPKAGRCEVAKPGQAPEQAVTDESGVLSGVRAARAGDYAILQNGATVRRIGASLLSPSETALASIERIEFNERLHVSAAESAVKSDWPLWPSLLVAALGVLLVEWWFFQRKPGGWK